MIKECVCTLDGKNATDECKEMIEIFEHYDKDKSGTIELNELKNIVQTVAGKVSKKEIEIGFSLIDKNKNGKIDFNEFVKWWKNR